MPVQRFGNNAGRKRNEQRANIRKEGRAQCVFEPAIVQIHADQSTAFFDRGLDLVLYEHGLRKSVVTNQEDERVDAADLRGAYGFDVVGSLRVDGLIQLEVREVEVDVLVSFPGAHQIVSPFVCAAETDESLR